jgi:hypothetical protein
MLMHDSIIVKKEETSTRLLMLRRRSQSSYFSNYWLGCKSSLVAAQLNEGRARVMVGLGATGWIYFRNSDMVV